MYFQKNLQKNGVSDEVYSLINDVQIRPSTHIIVTKCTAKYYLEESTPGLEILIPKYYEFFPNTSKYTGYVCDATIGDFFNALHCNACEPYATLGGINDNNAENDKENANNDSASKSNNESIQGKRKTQNTGVAIFKSSKLVGELNSMETVCFLNIKNNVDMFLVSIPDPKDENDKIDIYLTPCKKPKIDVSIVNGTPYIKLDFNFSGKIYSMKQGSNYLSSDVLELIRKNCNNYLKMEFENYLYKTTTVYQSDINGFGNYASSSFLTTKAFNNYDWLNNYKNSCFEVNVNTIIDSGFILNET